jgi:hypothetical protein
MSTDLNRQQVVARTTEMLEMAKTGLRDVLSPDPSRTRAGAMNMLTYGRSVTFTMQTIKGLDPDFEDWWRPYQEAMAADPLMAYCNDARVAVVHKGHLTSSNVTRIGMNAPVNLGELQRRLMANAPPGTTGMFLGDHLGGNGWIVEGVGHVYFELPDDLDVQSGLEFENPPVEHDGQPITDASIGHIGQLYIDKLSQVVDGFKARYG